MNFELTDDRRMLADTLQRFITNEYAFEVREKIAGTASGFSASHWRHFGELGVIGALFPERQGGYGGAGYDVALVFEALGRGLVIEPFLTALLAGDALASGTKAVHKSLLDELLAGTAIATFAHSEAAAGYAMSYVATTATEVDGGWLINGSKTAVQLGESSEYFVLSARVSGAPDDEDGIALFVLPRDTPGLQVHGYRNIDGGCAADLSLRDVALPADAILVPAGAAYSVLLAANGRALLALCAEALGAMEAAKEATLDYLRTRKQFGVPIGSFQALQHRMADLLLDIEQVRSAVINAAALLDTPGRERERALSAAKYSVGRVGTRVAEECIQLHGGIGMTWELPLSHYAKRLIMIDHQLGDEDYHLQRYIKLGHA